MKDDSEVLGTRELQKIHHRVKKSHFLCLQLTCITLCFAFAAQLITASFIIPTDMKASRVYDSEESCIV